MEPWFRIAAAVALVFIVIDEAAPALAAKIPFSGEPLKQTAVLFLLVYITFEVLGAIDAIKSR